MDEKKEKRCLAERIIVDIFTLSSKFPFIKEAKETAAFLKLLKNNLEEMKKSLNSNDAFKKLAESRAAAKYFKLTRAEVEKKLKEQYAAEMAKFERAQSMSQDDYDRIQSMNERAMKKRAEAKAEKKGDDISDLLKDI